MKLRFFYVEVEIYCMAGLLRKWVAGRLNQFAWLFGLLGWFSIIRLHYICFWWQGFDNRNGTVGNDCGIKASFISVSFKFLKSRMGRFLQQTLPGAEESEYKGGTLKEGAARRFVLMTRICDRKKKLCTKKMMLLIC